MKSTSSSMARRRTRRAPSGSLGSPQMPGPVSRIAPNPSRFRVRSPPSVMVPAAFAEMVLIPDEATRPARWSTLPNAAITQSPGRGEIRARRRPGWRRRASAVSVVVGAQVRALHLTVRFSIGSPDVAQVATQGPPIEVERDLVVHGIGVACCDRDSESVATRAESVALLQVAPGGRPVGDVLSDERQEDERLL